MPNFYVVLAKANTLDAEAALVTANYDQALKQFEMLARVSPYGVKLNRHKGICDSTLLRESRNHAVTVHRASL